MVLVGIVQLAQRESSYGIQITRRLGFVAHQALTSLFVDQWPPLKDIISELEN